jgi:GTP-binding protein SAR1
MWSVFTWMRDFIAEYTWFWWSPSDSRANTVLLVGLDDAGKTTLAGRLSKNCLVQAQPTGQPSTHEMKIGSTLLSVTDIGGHEQARRIWRNYMFSSTRIIFVIDASNRQRIPEARHELLKILNDEDIQSMPILILANKIDRTHTACSESELQSLLQIEEHLHAEDPRVKLCMCSIARNEGFTDGLKWLVKKPIKLDD